MPLLGASLGAAAAATEPKNAEAYDLYMRAAAISRNPAPNKTALPLLERSVQIDPSYAPAWLTLGERYYYDGTYSDGGTPALEKARNAAEKAIALDPVLITPRRRLLGGCWRVRVRWWRVWRGGRGVARVGGGGWRCGFEGG